MDRAGCRRALLLLVRSPGGLQSAGGPYLSCGVPRHWNGDYRFTISYAYSRIIEHFPSGGGGYIVATHTLGEKAGVLSGSALLVDYMLTITVSIAACADALFSFVPVEFRGFKLVFAASLIIVLILLNLRGVKESVTVLAPIFLTFILTHMLLLGYGILSHTSQIQPVVTTFQTSLSQDLATIGVIGILAIFLRAYSLGGGTYTGIEAVANGLQVMQEPKVQNGKRTMAYMATSLACVAGGLFLCYLLWQVVPVEGMTLNAILAGRVFEGWPLGGWLTVLITSSVIGACILIQRYYRKVTNGMRKFDDLLMNIPNGTIPNTDPVNPQKKTAVQLVSGFHGFGVRTFLSIIQNFPNLYENFIFVSVAVVDSGTFKGAAEVKALEMSVRASLEQYVDLARSFGFPAEYRMEVGTDVVKSGVDLCKATAKEFPDSTFFTGQIVFRHEHPFQKILHNETAFAIQRNLQFSGITTVILPIQAEK